MTQNSLSNSETESTNRVVSLDSSDAIQSRESIQQMAEVKSLGTDELDRRKIIYPGTLDRGLLDAFRNLRTTLVQKGGRQNFVVLVSSVCPKGGGTFVGLNLAAAFALDSSKTSLIIDCNVLEPQLDGMLSMPPDYGLIDFLEDPNIQIDDIIYSSGIPRLRMIPAGRRSELGPELFSSARMHSLIAGLRQRYEDRYIILDVPSLDSSAEVRVLAEVCDQALLVVPHGRVTQAQIMAATDVVGRNKLSGVVFNN